MIPFPGESVAIGGTYPGGILTDLTVRAGTAVLAAGDEWSVWAYPGETTYLDDPGTDVTVSWVVEVAAGSGTVTASWGFDPTYSDETAATPNSLGSHTVTGPTTLVLPTTLTAADVLTNPDAFHLRLTGDSGSLTVQQVKLRVWPTAGVAGGWSDVQPSFVTDWTDATPYYNYTGNGGSATTSDAAGSWAAAWAALTPTVTADFQTGASPARAFAGQSVPGPDLVRTGVQIPSILTVIPGRDWKGDYGIAPTLVDGVDYIRPPEEVAGDYPAYVQQVGSGSTEWDNAYAAVRVVPEPPALDGGHTLATGVRDDVTTTPVSGGIAADVTNADVGGASIITGTLVNVALPTSGRFIIARLTHSTLDAPMAWPGTTPTTLTPTDYVAGVRYAFGAGDPDGVMTPIRSRAVLPPYRMWNPAVVTVDPLRLMQRGDGLGMGSGRLLGAGTRQSSTRLYGSL